MSDAHDPRFVSRRELLKAGGLIGAAAALPISVFAEGAPPETLTVSEFETLEAIVTRLIPSDENGPGAREAQAARYIDRALGGFLSAFRPAYAAGLSAIVSYSKASKGDSFVKLLPEAQDAVLTDMEKNIATGFSPNASTFFDLVRAHTIQGTFSDPFYGGNANFVGWDLIAYPGVRTAVTAEQQRMGVPIPVNRRSAYDFSLFAKPSEE